MNSHFANYVQSVAFNMTLSRHMIEGLGLIRDFGRCFNGGNSPVPVSARVNSYAVPIAHALKRRGLVEHYNDVSPSKKVATAPWVYRLTRAGELTCELLVEADLLPAAMPVKKRKAA
jgi:hypothetical protein